MVRSGATSLAMSSSAPSSSATVQYDSPACVGPQPGHYRVAAWAQRVAAWTRGSRAKCDSPRARARTGLGLGSGSGSAQAQGKGRVRWQATTVEAHATTRQALTVRAVAACGGRIVGLELDAHGVRHDREHDECDRAKLRNHSRERSAAQRVANAADTVQRSLHPCGAGRETDGVDHHARSHRQALCRQTKALYRQTCKSGSRDGSRYFAVAARVLRGLSVPSVFHPSCWGRERLSCCRCRCRG
eukprot:scaffold120508_cov63-Phaeocystis_antarctica.AAC.4